MSARIFQYPMKPIAKQSGAALVVALIILALVTVIGVANMQSATLEMKMIASTIDRNKSFAIAEAALTLHERNLIDTVNDLDDLFTDVCNDTDLCFDSSCAGGWCFNGSFTSSMQRDECEVDPVLASASWRNAGEWSDDSKYQTIVYRGVEVKGMYEFLCFIGSSPLFRVTAYLESDGAQSPVMLQSTYTYAIAGAALPEDDL